MIPVWYNSSNIEVTVLLAVFNGEQYVHNCIESVLNQTFTNFEFVIINDCSTDSTKEIIKSFKDKRIKLINNQNNIGLTKSLNVGLKQAKGTYIARIDADDIMISSRLEKQVNFLKGNPLVSVVGSQGYYITEKNQIINPFNWETGIENCIFQIITGNNPVGHPFVLFEKKAIDNIGNYNETYLKAQDYELWLRCFYNELLFDNLDQNLTKYRNHKNQITKHRNLEDIINNQVDVFYLYFKKCTNNKLINKTNIKDYLHFFVFNKNSKLTVNNYSNIIFIFNLLLRFLNTTKHKKYIKSVQNIFYNKTIKPHFQTKTWKTLLNPINVYSKYPIYLKYYISEAVKRKIKRIFKCAE